MSEARKKTDWPIVVALALGVMLVPFCLYIAGYFVLSHTVSMEGYTTRVYRGKWPATIFSPAARVESLLTGQEVDAASWKEMADYP